MNIPRAKIGKDENEIRSLWKKKDTNSPSPLLPIKRRPRFSAVETCWNVWTNRGILLLRAIEQFEEREIKKINKRRRGM